MGGEPRELLARLEPDGSTDADFANPHLNGAPLILVARSGRLLLGGYFTEIGGQTRNFIARLTLTDLIFADGFNGSN
jgi:hypothetical protein